MKIIQLRKNVLSQLTSILFVYFETMFSPGRLSFSNHALMLHVQLMLSISVCENVFLIQQLESWMETGRERKSGSFSIFTSSFYYSSRSLSIGFDLPCERCAGFFPLWRCTILIRMPDPSGYWKCWRI